ncbi:hypothetical protein ABIF86_002445 [Bradyrhizobium japonicum]
MRVSKDAGPAGGLALRDAREERAPQGEGLAFSLPKDFVPNKKAPAHDRGLSHSSSRTVQYFATTGPPNL